MRVEQVISIVVAMMLIAFVLIVVGLMFGSSTTYDGSDAGCSVRHDDILTL